MKVWLPLDRSWRPGQVCWLSEAADVALVRLTAPALGPIGEDPAFGRLVGDEPVAVRAAGFPWAQAETTPTATVRYMEELPDAQVFPLSHSLGGADGDDRYDVQILGSVPTALRDAAAWAWMSGAAVFAADLIVGIIIEEPFRYGTDRLVALPSTYFAADPAFKRAAGLTGGIRAAWSDSAILRPPYRALPAVAVAESNSPVLLLQADYEVVPYQGRRDDLNAVLGWATDARPAAVQLITGAGGSGKSRLAAEVAARVSSQGWVTGVLKSGSPPEAVRRCRPGQSAADRDR